MQLHNASPHTHIEPQHIIRENADNKLPRLHLLRAQNEQVPSVLQQASHKQDAMNTSVSDC
jgi:hypothetical protein